MSKVIFNRIWSVLLLLVVSLPLYSNANTWDQLSEPGDDSIEITFEENGESEFEDDSSGNDNLFYHQGNFQIQLHFNRSAGLVSNLQTSPLKEKKRLYILYHQLKIHLG